jgi:NADH-quinone oxidoreductase subunit H
MLLKIICLLISIAYFTIAERKIMAAIQRRKGPDVVGPYGLLQPLADGLKLLLKEMLIPTRANAFIFILAPITILTLSLISWSIIPFGFSDDLSANATSHKQLIYYFLFQTAAVANVHYGLLFLLAISSLNVYSIILAG